MVTSYNKNKKQRLVSLYTTFYSSFNHITSLIHPSIGKLEALTYTFSISSEMCALDGLFPTKPRLLPSVAKPLGGGIWADNRYTVWLQVEIWHLLISVSTSDKPSFISNKVKSLFDHLKRHRWHATRITGQTCRQDVVIMWLRSSQQSLMHSF